MFESLERRVFLAVHTPMTAAQLSAVLNGTSAPALQLGDTIILDADTTYVGSFTLRNVTAGSGMITIQSSRLNQLPGAGVRVSPADAANMPNIQSAGSNQQAIKTVAGAHNFQFIGVEVVGPANNSNLTTLVELGNDSQTLVSDVPHHIHFDRSYFRPNTPSANIRRAFGLHSQFTDITNSYIEEIHEGGDSNAIAGWNGLGNYNIINNHLEGAGENIMFGGATNKMPTPVTNVVIRGNHIIKPLHWRDGSKGFTATVKNLFELKQGSNILLEDNILENCWTSGQTGVAIVLKLGDYDVSPQNVTEDVIIRNNIIRHANGAIALQGRDYASNSPEGLVRRLTFTNNLFEDINGYWGTSMSGGGTFNIYLTHGPKDVTMNHNTFLNGSTTIEIDPNSSTYENSNFKFDNNIVDHNDYGIRSPSGTGNVTINAYLNTGAVSLTKNILVNTPWAHRNSYTSRPGNFILANSANTDMWANVGFQDMANRQYQLAASSIYNDAGTDGKDVGADFALVADEFAYMDGTTLMVDMARIANAPRPVTLTVNGSNVTATYDGEILNFVNVTGIGAAGNAGDDRAQLAVNVLTGSTTIANDLGGAGRNALVNVSAGASATLNATQHLRDLLVAGNVTLSAGGNKVLVTKGLALTGKLNLTNNDMVYDYTGGSQLGSYNGSSYTGVTGLVAAGRNGGGFDGNGIITNESMALSGQTMLGVAEASDLLGISGNQTTTFSGETIDASSILVKYTWCGDATLDGELNGDDYFAVDSQVQQSGSVFGFTNGDINFDGEINGDDYFLIDSNILFSQNFGTL